MSRSDEIPEGIQWHEGMLLTPQHFQQLSARIEALIHYHAQAVAPFHWGVIRLRLDPVLLVSGRLRVLELEAIMPDGLAVTHSADREDPLEIDFTGRVDELSAKPGTIHVAVPARRPGALSHSGEFPRYSSVPGPTVIDESAGTSELRIPRLRPRLSLLLDDNPPAKYVTFPIARVARRNEAFGLTDFVPPHLTVPVGSTLGQLCDQVAKRLREKALVLSEKARSPSLTMGSPLLLETKSQVSHMVAALPPFEAALYTGAAHPYSLYLALCTLVGHLSALGTGLVPPVVGAYNHNEILACFQGAMEHINRMLEEGILESYTAFPFEDDEGAFQLGFIWTWMARQLVLGVRGQPGMSESDIIAWMEECLIGSRDIIPSLRQNRVLGAERVRIDRDRDLVPSRGVVLFSLKPDPRFIETNKVLQILNTADRPNRPRPAEIVLYVKNAS